MIARLMTVMYTMRNIDILQEPSATQQKKCDKTSGAGSFTSVKCVHYNFDTC